LQSPVDKGIDRASQTTGEKNSDGHSRGGTACKGTDQHNQGADSQVQQKLNTQKAGEKQRIPQLKTVSPQQRAGKQRNQGKQKKHHQKLQRHGEEFSCRQLDAPR